MAESNSTQVILTDDGIKIINAQNTADNAAGGVTDLNDPNLMSVIEKQTQASQYAGLASQYNVILERAKEANISTTTLTTAYTNLNTFMTAILTDTTKASDVNRDTYKSLTDAYNTALSNVQTALSNSFNTDIDNMQSSVSVASQAASSAAIVASQAATTGDNASKVASQALTSANQAQSAGDNATSVANNASQAASSAVLAGSTATVSANKASTAASQAQIAGNNATSIANNASKAASSAILAGSTATVNANKASTAASQAQIAGNNATSVANNATSIANNANSVANNASHTASSAASSAILVGSQASSEIAVQSTATAKAQSTADNAFSQATTAIDNGQAVSQAVTSLKDGSTLTIAELGNGLATKVANSDYASYKIQTASQIASKVDNGAFSAYKQTTADLISSKVATSDFSSYKDQTATAISSKVDSSDFNTYKQQTDGAILSKVSKKDANNVNLIPYSAMPNANNLRWFEIGGGGTLSATTHAFYHSGADSLYELNTAGSNEVFAISPRFKINANTTYTFQMKGFASSNVSSMDVYVLGRKNGETKDYTVVQEIITGTRLSNSALDYRTVTFTTGAIDEAYIRVDNNGSTNGNVSILGFTELKLEPGDTATPYVYGAEDTMISQMSDDINLRVTKGDLIDQINIQAGNTLISSSGQLTLSGKSVLLDSANPVIMNSANIANLAVGTAQIGNGAITNAKIANLAVGTAQIANGAITNAQIGSLAVDTANIKDAAINSAKIGSLAVGTAQIADAAITSAKIGSLAVGTAQIANGAITSAKIGNAAVGTAQIGNAAVGTAQIANLAVGTAQIGNAAITSAKIANLAVGTAQIANAAITDAQVGNVSANKLTAGTIDFNTITGKNINASNITTGTLDTNRLNVGQLSALSANLGNVTTGSLKGVDIVAKTFSTPNGSFTTDASGAITAKNMTLIGGTLTSPTINASTINGSTINGTTFNAGNKLNQYGNTSYPLTINQDGSVTSTSFETIGTQTAALRTVIKNGVLTSDLRGMTQFTTGAYLAIKASLGAGQLTLQQGYSTSQDANFTNNSVTTTGYVTVDSNTGITLHGDNQWIRFNGYANDNNPQGIVMTPWGNINPQGNQSDWYVGNKNTDKTAQFGIDADHKVTINLFRPTFVDEIGALGNQLDSGRLLLHDVAGTAQMYLLNDGSPAFVSPTIFNRTYSYGTNMYVTSQGRVGRATSASKYKLAIARSDDTAQADRLMTLNLASWNDKVATEKMAESLSNGEIPVEAEINLKRHYGLIAEDLRDAGLDEFLITGKDGQIEGIEYDRLWTVLIPKIKQLNNRINELERKTL